MYPYMFLNIKDSFDHSDVLFDAIVTDPPYNMAESVRTRSSDISTGN
jgi:DNA modification methylase